MTTTLTTNAKDQVNNLWGLSNDAVFTLVKQSENHTYTVETSSDKKYVLRLTPTDHRSKEAIKAELTYISLIHSCAAGTLHVCPPVALARDSEEFVGHVVPYDDGKEYYAALFTYAKGEAVLDKWRGLTDDSIVSALGQALGKLHKIVSQKGNDAEKYAQMEKYVPLSEETHSGATQISRIQERAQSGHEPSQLLLDIWNKKLAGFFDSLQKSDKVYGVIHGDLNVSNFFAEQVASDSLPNIYVFDFDQLQKNYFGVDVGVILHGARFFEEDGLGIGKIDGFDANRYRSLFLAAYKEAFPEMVQAGHMDEDKLASFELYRDFYHAGVAVDILFQAENGKQFEAAITGFCQIVVNRLKKKFADS